LGKEGRIQEAGTPFQNMINKVPIASAGYLQRASTEIAESSMHLEKNVSILKMRCRILAGDSISITSVDECVNGRSMILEECCPYSGRCTAGGEDALSVSCVNCTTIPVGGCESGVDQTGVMIQSHHSHNSLRRLSGSGF
jgi:hypothetical protein